jgi:hypothetical protein
VTADQQGITKGDSMLSDKILMPLKRDKRPQLGSWAAGDYFNICNSCGMDFIGDKRAMVCADCAYDAAATTKETL